MLVVFLTILREGLEFVVCKANFLDYSIRDIKLFLFYLIN